MQHPMFSGPQANMLLAADLKTTKGPRRRQREHLQEAKEALLAFRYVAKSQYLPVSSFIAAVVFPDRILNTLASNMDIKTLEDLEVAAKMPWTFGRFEACRNATTIAPDGVPPTLFDKVIEIIQNIDKPREEAKQAVK